MEIIVACPNCSYQLHLPNRDFLGRKGKCPKCEHKFVMQESQASPQAAPQPKPKPQPAEPSDHERKTVLTSGKTHADHAPVSSQPKDDFKKLRDSDSGEEEGGAVDGEDSSDSELVPAELWDDIDTPPLPETNAGGSSASRSAVFDIVARCPQCHAGVDFQRDDDLRDYSCPRCNTQFSLIHPEAPPAALQMPKQVGSYPLHKQPRIGIGPFGSVFRAKDGQSNEAVAVKVARGDQVSEQEREKFLAGLRLVMQLKHPNIAALHELDCVEGRVYLVSHFISGIDLSEYLTGLPDRQFSFREVASLCALIASVLHHAHKFGVVHGNLKPSNIRLDGDQKPYIFDFGLSRREKAVLTTANGRIVGTAAYLAPEQLPGNRRDPDAQTDVFALGVIFYELLTGRRPFPGQGPELLKQIARGAAPPPRSIKSTVPKPLDTICMKCLEGDRRDRYQSAMEVYKELRLYLEDKPIHTKPPGMLTRLGRWCRRRPIVAGMLLTFFVLAVAATGFVGWRMWQTGGFS